MTTVGRKKIWCCYLLKTLISVLIQAASYQAGCGALCYEITRELRLYEEAPAMYEALKWALEFIEVPHHFPNAGDGHYWHERRDACTAVLARIDGGVGAAP